MARLNFDIPLRAEDIVAILPLTQQQPVWIVKGLEGSSIVIKAESKGENMSVVVQQASKIMSLVSPSARMKVLDNSEMMALRNWVRFAQLTDDKFDEDWTRGALEVSQNLNNSMRAFVKMETMRLTSFEEGNDPASKKIGKALNAPNGLEDMGKIIAADLFNGNNDRFDFSNILRPGTRGTQWGPKKKQLNYLINPGNFMVAEQGNEAKLVGMDPFDRSSRVASLSTPVNDEWPYFIFAPQHRTNLVPQIAGLCAYDLKKVVGKTTGLISRARLDKHAGQRIAEGMIQGANLIENHFRMLYGKPKAIVPTGFASRAQVAGWTWFVGGTTTSQAFGNLTRANRN